MNGSYKLFVHPEIGTVELVLYPADSDFCFVMDHVDQATSLGQKLLRMYRGEDPDLLQEGLERLGFLSEEAE